MIRAGLRRVTIDGEKVDVTSEGVSYSLGGIQQTEIVGADNYHGTAGKPVAPFLAFSITDSKALKLSGLLDKQDVTVVAELLNGKTLVLSKAVNTSERTGETNEGKIALRYVGHSMEEI
jgi:hypothetical protein